jgi:hypothetical protein
MGPLELMLTLVTELIEGILGAVINFLNGLLGTDVDFPS